MIVSCIHGFALCNFSYLQSALENIKWKVPEINISFTLCVNLSTVMKSHAVLIHPAWDANHPFVQRVHTVYATHPVITWQPSQLSHWLSWYHGACVQVALILLGNGPKSNDADNLGMPKRNHKVFNMYVYIGKNSICRVQEYLWFQASTECLGMHSCR